ncbi:hypothetical protein QYF36_025029 [Acer negundo]|nr:hypothetical protein QYF36_025029 [Acer negundo]
MKTKLKKRVCFKDSSESPYGKQIRPDKSVSDDSASRKAPSKFDTNLVLYTQILPSAGPQSSRDSNATSSQRRRSFRPNYSHPVEARPWPRAMERTDCSYSSWGFDNRLINMPLNAKKTAFS